ncbi:Atrial natriuretic peptide receptor 1 [Eumeta japonica]|uniref:Guanylate cyclase n=1 Tax=Eumeta variegata TaxID=151549 RepID=A0A4C1XYC1_EUMVA|nr:Atrial natriuretic peptide receptor 1 [Eumeta japonica]
MARTVSHENTVRFIGACVESPVFVLTEYCPKGSLKDVLENRELELDWNFRTSLVHDIVQGMCYLHGGLGAHGKLRSSNCLIDGRFVLKISDFGLTTLCAPTDVVKDDIYYYNHYGVAVIFPEMLWVAPELVEGCIYPGAVATLKGDVYSFAIILEEIVSRAGPFHRYTPKMSYKESLFKAIVSRVCAHESPPFRPVIDGVVGAGAGTALELLQLAERCWTDVPDDRPSFDTVNANYIKGYCDNLMDDLLRRMEQYANNLESLVEEKTAQLSLEKRRSEELLYQVLPSGVKQERGGEEGREERVEAAHCVIRKRFGAAESRPVALQLMAGEVVRPESFECVTVYFSDIVGFTELCAASTPMQVVDLLNDLYSTFDRIIGFYDVYKVETIGDAYMVVSGLPERNGDHHAREICLMALAVVEAVRGFVVRHRPTHRLEVRVGVHSGPVCAGVVGVKMPHYCLFGDTVNTASRMESTGQPLRIHLSESTRRLLEQWGTFVVERRGEVELKGRGMMLTHWLLNCSEPESRPPALGPQLTPHYPILFPPTIAAAPMLQPYLVVEPATLAA